MKSVLISIQPKWCELIASGKKTIEVRKRAPKDKDSFKVYIYQTKKKWIYRLLKKIGLYQGKVIGEFVCDRITHFDECEYFDSGYGYLMSDTEKKEICLTDGELEAYGKYKPLYGWHISDLKIYDKPREISEFKRVKYIRGYHRKGESKIETLMHSKRVQVTYLDRPPQSWCYVEVPE